MEQLSILLIDDDPVFQKITSTVLKKEYTVYEADNAKQGFEILAKTSIDLLITDYRLPDMDGLGIIMSVKAKYPELEVIMITSQAETEVVVQAMRAGAIDFFTKPFNMVDIKLAMERTKRYTTLKNKLRSIEMYNSALSYDLNGERGYELISVSPQMENIKDIMYKVAQTHDTSVIITGESGTGKELIARGIHIMSDRKNNYFGAVNTSAIPETLFESEFFGHKKGAFTGAIAERAGWFEVANKGTLFLDEIGDMHPNLQIKLLRVLEDRRFIKVGSQKENSFDIRIVAATNKPKEDLTSGKDFRLDLYHRLGTFEIYVPPLRDRVEDIPVLLKHFVNHFSGRMKKKIAKIDNEVINYLCAYKFPGNVRELRNITERATILCDDKTLTLDHFQVDRVSNVHEQAQIRTFEPEIFDLEELEKKTILKALERTDNNKSQAAELLNIKWNALHRRLQKHGIELNE